MRTATRPDKLALDFGALPRTYHVNDDDAAKAPIANLSAAAWAEPHLWVVSDETGSLERLTRTDDGFGDAKSFPMSAFLAGFPNKEADLEAMSYDAEAKTLWFCGSHATARQATEEATAQDLIDAHDFELKNRRCLLGFVKLADGEPDGGAALPLGDAEGGLRRAIRQFGRAFENCLALPSKENGLDIEGMAAKGNALLIGLRGPTVGGHAVVLRVRTEMRGRALAIAGPIGVALLRLQGLGVRDITLDGENGVFVLAGPTFDLDAPFRLYRWVDAFASDASREVVGGGLAYLCDLTAPAELDKSGSLTRSERPEAVAVLGENLLILHDRPGGAHHKAGAPVLYGDLLPLSEFKSSGG